MKVRFQSDVEISNQPGLTLVSTEDGVRNYTLEAVTAEEVERTMTSLGYESWQWTLVPEPLRLKYVNDQMVENGQEVLLLIDEDGEVHASLYRLGSDLWRVAVRRSIRRFHGIGNAKAFARRKIEETLSGREMTIADGGSVAEVDDARDLGVRSRAPDATAEEQAD